MKRIIMSATLVLLTLCAAGGRAAGDETRSAPPAAALKAQLQQLKIEAFAVRDPDEPGRYIAALYVPDVQFLVVSAPYAYTAAIEKNLAAGRFMDVYVDIQGVRDHKGHFFVEDLQADGLAPGADRDLAFDTTTLDGATPVVFNGKWGAQQLTEEEYTARFQRDDERYARMLTVLSTALARRITVP